jgi:hypothetical protein
MAGLRGVSCSQTHPTVCPGAWFGRRSGIKEELSAISRHGGQPRSRPSQASGRTTLPVPDAGFQKPTPIHAASHRANYALPPHFTWIPEASPCIRPDQPTRLLDQAALRHRAALPASLQSAPAVAALVHANTHWCQSAGRQLEKPGRPSGGLARRCNG